MFPAINLDRPEAGFFPVMTTDLGLPTLQWASSLPCSNLGDREWFSKIRDYSPSKGSRHSLPNCAWCIVYSQLSRGKAQSATGIWVELIQMELLLKLKWSSN